MGTYLTLPGDLSQFRPDLDLSVANSTPTQAEGEAHLVELEGELENAAATSGYTVPITGARSLLAVSVALKWAMAAYAYRARGYGDDTGDPDEDVRLGHTKWEKFIANVLALPMFLSDAPTGAGGFESPHRKGFKSLWSEDTEAVDLRIHEVGKDY
tara:strand:- start:251 stop:718 length:468 start_codon:yes stop_codon:yes gene_type:complete